MKVKYAALSLFVSVVLLGAKIVAYDLTNSAAVLSDALESIVNVLAAAIALVVLRFASKPADKDHPYGHGKVEYFSATFEGGLITFAGVMIVLDSIRSIRMGYELKELELGLLITVAAGVANGLMGFFLVLKGKSEKSEALRASGHHLLSDMWTTVGVLIGLGLVKLTGIKIFDSIAAIVVALNLIYIGFSILRRSSGALLDAEDPSLILELKKHFDQHGFPGIIRIHALRIMRSGSYHHIDAHVVVPEFWDVAKTHKETDHFENSVIRSYSHDGEVHFHVDPCRKLYCKICDLKDCPIRKEKFESKPPSTVEELTSPIEMVE